MSDQEIEQEILDKGLTAPRVTPADIDANILEEFYINLADAIYGEHIDSKNVLAGSKVQYQALSLVTQCVIVLRNGFTVTGESACASPENFDAELERKIARENAINKLWPLMGYELKQRLFEAK